MKVSKIREAIVMVSSVVVAVFLSGCGSSGSGSAAQSGPALIPAVDAANGIELYKTDGSVEGTAMVKDINPGSASGLGTDLTAVVGAEAAEMDGITYFAADDGVNQRELWRTDGTEEGSWMVKDIYPEFYSTPQAFVVIGSTLYFSALNTDDNFWLFKSDGTEAGTEAVHLLGANPASTIAAVGETLYFAMGGLWSYDGTEAVQLSAVSNIANLTEFNGKLYFTANDGVNGAELWESDGTEAGTKMLIDIAPGAAGSAPEELTVFDGALYFRATVDANIDLWKSDGTAEGTAAFHADALDLSNLAVSGGALYFAAVDGQGGQGLWKSDGTQDGTVMVAGGFANLYQLTDVNGKVFFVGSESEHGAELWASDGTAGGTALVKDIVAGTAHSGIRVIRSHNGILYFAPTNSADETGVWRSDGTAEGTFLLLPDDSGTLYDS